MENVRSSGDELVTSSEGDVLRSQDRDYSLTCHFVYKEATSCKRDCNKRKQNCLMERVNECTNNCKKHLCWLASNRLPKNMYDCVLSGKSALCWMWS